MGRQRIWTPYQHRFSRELVSLFNTLKGTLIWRDQVSRQVVHAFIKSNMIGFTNVSYFTIVPKTISNCVWNKTKKYTLLWVGFKLGFSFSWGMDQDTAAKGAKFGKVLLLSSSLEDTRGVLLGRSKRIWDAKMVKKRRMAKIWYQEQPLRVEHEHDHQLICGHVWRARFGETSLFLSDVLRCAS